MTSTTPQAPPRSGGHVTAIVIGIVLIVIGALMALAGGGMLFGGAAAAGVAQSRDAEGYLSARPVALTSDSYAITSPSGAPMGIGGDATNLPFDVATLRLSVTSDSGPVFVGVASQSDIDEYLAGVAHSEVQDVRVAPTRVSYREVSGSAPTTAPEDLDVWVSSASGRGTQELQWPIAQGNWGVVVMNADGSSGVDVEAQVGVRSDLIAPATTLLVVLGVIVLLLGLGAVVGGAILLGIGTSRGRHAPPPMSSPAAGAPASRV